MLHINNKSAGRYLYKKPCVTTQKSEAIAQCKEIPVIPVDKVADEIRIIGKRWSVEEEGHSGSLTKKMATCCAGNCPQCLCMQMDSLVVSLGMLAEVTA
jgi:hypothetical protein